MGIFSDVLLTVDYDRTLTAPDSTIPERNLEAIRYFIENGGAFTVNTGRSVPMTKVFRDKVPVNAPLLLYNGSAAYDVAKKQLTFCHAIDLDLWETVGRCEKLLPDLTVEVQGIDAHYRFSENPAWDAFSEHQDCAHAFARPGDDLGAFLKFTIYGQFRDVTVAHMFEGTPEEKRRMDEAEEMLCREFGEVLEQESGVKVVLQDERFTTAESESILLEADLSRRKRKKKIDQMAAVAILQRYLDSHQS